MNKYKTTLSEDIQQLSDPQYKISINDKESAQLVVDLVMKFFHNYIYIDSYNQKLDISETSKALNDYIEMNIVWLIASKKNPQNQTPLQKAKISYCYTLDMLWSIYSTTEIIIDIINKKIDPKKFDDKFIGLDLWTGSWILLLAQYILSNRNKFKNYKWYWIEIDNIVHERSKQIAKSLNFWDIINWDTTKEDVFRALQIKNNITFISNETIPTSSQRMNKPTTDPFIFNNYLILNTLWNNITKAEFFPSELHVFDNKTKKIIRLSAQNNFWINDIKDIKHAEIIAFNLTPNYIIINWKKRHLTQVGNLVMQTLWLDYKTEISYRR